jgi:hypothetical protein
VDGFGDSSKSFVMNDDSANGLPPTTPAASVKPRKRQHPPHHPPPTKAGEAKDGGDEQGAADTEISKLTVSALKVRLTERGLENTGLKADLISRLQVMCAVELCGRTRSIANRNWTLMFVCARARVCVCVCVGVCACVCVIRELANRCHLRS